MLKISVDKTGELVQFNSDSPEWSMTFESIAHLISEVKNTNVASGNLLVFELGEYDPKLAANNSPS
jgi:hypothetical protein